MLMKSGRGCTRITMYIFLGTSGGWAVKGKDPSMWPTVYRAFGQNNYPVSRHGERL